MKKVRFGVLGAAKIAVEKVIPAMKQCRFAEATAIASRSADKAAQAARSLGVPRHFGSYEAMLADPEIDAVYNPLPNHLHVPLSIDALRAGKHVLCEKPIALSVAEAQSLVDEGRRHPRLKLMEAFMYRMHPQWVEARRLVQGGAIGELRAIDALFSYCNLDPNNVRNLPNIGGGGLMDIGCYPISLSRFLFDAEPRRAIGTLDLDPQFGVDRLCSAVLDFEVGTATFTCATQIAAYQRVNIVGTAGRIEIEIPFNAPPDRPCRLWLQTASGTEERRFEICDQYAIQADLFAQAILSDGPVPTPIEDAVDNMRVIEAIVRSHESGAWETP